MKLYYCMKQKINIVIILITECSLLFYLDPLVSTSGSQPTQPLIGQKTDTHWTGYLVTGYLVTGYQATN